MRVILAFHSSDKEKKASTDGELRSDVWTTECLLKSASADGGEHVSSI